MIEWWIIGYMYVGGVLLGIGLMGAWAESDGGSLLKRDVLFMLLWPLAVPPMFVWCLGKRIVMGVRS